MGIKVWGIPGHEDHSKLIDMDIVHEDNGYVVDLNKFDSNLDARHGSAARERIVEYQDMIKDRLTLSKIASAVDVIKEAKATLEKLTDYGEKGNRVKYYAEELAGLKD